MMNYFDEVKKIEEQLKVRYAEGLGKTFGPSYEAAFVGGALRSILACALYKMSRLNSAEADRFVIEQLRAHSGNVTHD